jgi:hypothetical protein
VETEATSARADVDVDGDGEGAVTRDGIEVVPPVVDAPEAVTPDEEPEAASVVEPAAPPVVEGASDPVVDGCGPIAPLVVADADADVAMLSRNNKPLRV